MRLCHHTFIMKKLKKKKQTISDMLTKSTKTKKLTRKTASKKNVNSAILCDKRLIKIIQMKDKKHTGFSFSFLDLVDFGVAVGAGLLDGRPERVLRVTEKIMKCILSD